MPTRASKARKRADDEGVGSALRALEDVIAAPLVQKNPHAQALSRLGAAKGGAARAAKLTPAKRRKIAAKAARARWAKERQKSE
jgi:hypothetical protein